MGTKQTIELNGKQYDARTGKILSVTKTPSVHSNTKPVNILMNKGTSIDGFSRKQSHPPRKVTQVPAHRSVSKSQTLKRTAVKKPLHPKAVKTNLPSITATAQAPAIDIQTPAFSIPEERLKRLHTVKKSSKISRFTGTITTPTTASHTTSHVTNHKNDHLPAVKAVSTVVGTTAPKDMFEQAIEKADSHAEAHPAKKSGKSSVANKLRVSSRTLNITGFVVAALLFTGYFGYNNMPNISMRLAAMNANVEGTIPAYKPSGFSLNRDIQYKQGEITLSFISNSDERQFHITQTASGWDSKALQQNFVAKQEHVRTMEDKGNTIYMYGKNNATWVDGGVWYKIEGNSQLNSEQLSRIASSL